MYTLSERSLSRLIGVDSRLADVVKLAIHYTSMDFAVLEGVRSLERQQELFHKGASQTMQSKHLDGLAVDLGAYIGDRISWELNLYDDIADAMREAATHLDVPLRWGAAWHIPDIREWDGSMQMAMTDYIDLRRSQNRRPFIDAPHFELT